MKGKAIWSLTIFQQILLKIATVFAVDENSLSRSAYFTTRQNKKLIGHVVQRFESPSLMSCSHSCMRNTCCSSTNFEQLTGRGDKGTCELNKHDIPTVNKDTNFQDRPGSTFSLHLKGCLSTGCLNGGSCLFDEKKDVFSCSCKLPWTEEECGEKTELEYHFTTLNTTGNEGPTSNAGYKGTSLENVSVTNGLQEWSVPLTGYYHVDMCGASGGGRITPRKGARVNGTVHLKEGTKLIVLVGQQGNKFSLNYGGGGGGTFVAFSSNSTPLSIAGGGAGVGYNNKSGPGQAGEAEGLLLGIVGQGGRLICVGSFYWRDLAGGYSGGGFRGDGECFNHSQVIKQCHATAAKSFLNGGRGGSPYYHHSHCCYGGFGGGGASHGHEHGHVAGGGGGYSGGSVNGTFEYHGMFASGGGGSFVPSETWNATTGACDKGDGYVTFRFLG